MTEPMAYLGSFGQIRRYAFDTIGSLRAELDEMRGDPRLRRRRKRIRAKIRRLRRREGVRFRVAMGVWLSHPSAGRAPVADALRPEVET